ncbi:EscU/YscU/HrcU family type III secretion system export apparatus switch protein [Alteromonas sp. ASW11-36]|uniref:Flagellar biosynthetic protein FlhB n=1 Tax=Alteromonas arenosi TaxID=3055817 RepID=A0ABT7T0I9_9ALTE|nr:EscU/YscU/HrcU family type III secretion system export apparatus switch protein [Alteromonas sp. ASW11-36]MDM7861954.1 EscU/YscU/HrcU family type III secretion system export apparatus switch protein [Alteromonas sp. ASW11-36]
MTKKKTKRAIGLKYSEKQGSAPEVTAKGFGDLAEEIISVAQQHGVLIHEDQHLSEFLGTLDLGQEIPEQLYYVIAELIAFSYVLQGKTPENWHTPIPGVNAKV